MRENAHGSTERSVPDPVLNRIPLYLRIAEDLRNRGVETVSSRKLAQILGLTDGQVRADLVFFGAFGRPGVGYRVEHLAAELRQIVGTDRVQPVAVIGFGSIGRALVMYEGFGQSPFEIAAVFDRDAAKIGRPAGACVVQDVSMLAGEVKRLGISMAILAVPAEAAQSLAEQLADAGVTGIMNFAPVSLKLPGHVAAINVDLKLTLERLSLRMKVAGRRNR